MTTPLPRIEWTRGPVLRTAWLYTEPKRSQVIAEVYHDTDGVRRADWVAGGPIERVEVLDLDAGEAWVMARARSLGMVP